MTVLTTVVFVFLLCVRNLDAGTGSTYGKIQIGVTSASSVTIGNLTAGTGTKTVSERERELRR